MTLELLLLLLCVLVLKMFFFKSKRQKYLEQIPGPKSYPIVGSLLGFFLSDEDPAIQVLNMPKEYGPVFLLWFGQNPVVCLTGPEDAEVVLGNRRIVDRADLFNHTFRIWVNRGLFTSPGEEWKKHRRMLTPAFTPSILQTFLPYFDLHARNFEESLLKHVGKEIDIVHLAGRYAFDVTIDTAMKLENVSERTKVMEALDELSVILGNKACNMFENTFLFHYMKVGKRFDQLNKYCQEVSSNMIKERKLKLEIEKSNTTCDEASDRRFKRPFLDLMLELKEEDGGFTDLEIRMQVDTIMVAAYDTTTSAIAFALYCLSQNLEIQEKAYNEVKSIFGDSDREATYQDLQEMKYLEKVINESLRLYTTSRYLARRTQEDVQLKSGYTIPKHCDVLIMVNSMHVDPKLFPEPHIFDPERFESKDFHPFSFMPFGGGARDCIGKRYALLSMKSLLSRILRRFRLLPSKVPIVPSYGIVMKSSSGVHLKVETRTH